jgi:hypothetical protein
MKNTTKVFFYSALTYSAGNVLQFVFALIYPVHLRDYAPSAPMFVPILLLLFSIVGFMLFLVGFSRAAR